MKRITTVTDLPGGERTAFVVAPSHIVVRIGDRICVAHHNWFDVAAAAEIAESLGIVVNADLSVPS